MARVDAEYHQQLRAEAEAALAKARADMPSDVDVTYVVHEAQSTSSGLLDLVHEHEAKMIVLDSSTAGVFGHVGSRQCHLPLAAQLRRSGRAGAEGISNQAR